MRGAGDLVPALRVSHSSEGDRKSTGVRHCDTQLGPGAYDNTEELMVWGGRVGWVGWESVLAD